MILGWVGGLGLVWVGFEVDFVLGDLGLVWSLGVLAWCLVVLVFSLGFNWLGVGII